MTFLYYYKYYPCGWWYNNPSIWICFYCYMASVFVFAKIFNTTQCMYACRPRTKMTNVTTQNAQWNKLVSFHTFPWQKFVSRFSNECSSWALNIFTWILLRLVCLFFLFRANSHAMNLKWCSRYSHSILTDNTFTHCSMYQPTHNQMQTTWNLLHKIRLYIFIFIYPMWKRYCVEKYNKNGYFSFIHNQYIR